MWQGLGGRENCKLDAAMKKELMWDLKSRMSWINQLLWQLGNRKLWSCICFLKSVQNRKQVKFSKLFPEDF